MWRLCSVEIARQHQLKRQFVGPGGHAKTYAGFDTQDLAGAIRGGPDLVELIVSRKKVAQRPAIGVLFDGSGPSVIHVIRDSRGRNEFEVSKTATVVRIDDRIKDNIHRMQVQSYDGPYLGGNAFGLPILVIDAKLEIDAVEKRLIVGVRLYEQFANLKAI